MPHKTHDIGVAARIGKYSDAIETAPNLRWLHTSGTPGLETDGNLPSNIQFTASLRSRRSIFFVRSNSLA